VDQCDECVDQVVKQRVRRLGRSNMRTDAEAALYQYLLTHSPGYMDETELQMLLTGVFDSKFTKIAVSSLMEALQKKLICSKLICLIEHKRCFGYRLSPRCALQRGGQPADA